ncbi:response regulator transcription factor [Paenibacillus sp. 1P07SE]|uniref:response regulator transcription factor n=1 Tax=Paenibacillus sp. 1P07SE TaxID=3132209 RepID=UPI0039A47D69
MINLLIVDDHKHIVEDMQGTIDWKSLSVTEVRGAYSGTMALEAMEEKPADIVITDIKMPGMTGLELVAAIRARWPQTKCIVLSGFAEFEYARQAILAQTSEYLLKPAGNEEIIEVMERVIKEWTQERESDSLHQRALMTLRANLPRLRENLLLDLLQKRSVSARAIVEQVRRYELDFEVGDEVAMLMIRLEDEFADYDEQSVALFEFAVRNMAEEVFGQRYALWHCKDPHDYLVFLVKRRSGDDRQQEALRFEALAEELQLSVKEYLKGSISILASSWGVFPASIGPLYQEALYSFRQRVGDEREFFLTIESKSDGLPIESIESLYDPPTFRQLFEAGRFEKIEDKMAVIFEELSRRWGDSQEHILEVFFELAGSFSYIMHKNGRRLHDLMAPADYERLVGAGPFQTIRQLQEWSGRAFRLLQQEMNKETVHNRSSVVQQIHEYIERHMDRDVSVQTLADHVYLHPSYLSRVYKVETGESISDYLYRYRMEKAAYLLKNTSDRIYEITASLGYQNPQYFIKIFKKYYGITPQEYRDKNSS